MFVWKYQGYVCISNDINGQICQGDFMSWKYSPKSVTMQPAITCSKLAIETPEQGMKYVQS